MPDALEADAALGVVEESEGQGQDACDPRRAPEKKLRGMSTRNAGRKLKKIGRSNAPSPTHGLSLVAASVML